jgi:hypothetical protein
MLGFTIFLLVANIIIDLTTKKKEKIFENDLSSLGLENNYLETLDEFGVDLKLIKVKPNRESGKDSVTNIINVQIPADIPFPVFLQSFQKKIDYPFVKLKSEEKKKDKEFTVKVFVNNIQKLESDVIRDENTRRTGVKLSFIITGFNSLSKGNQLELLQSPFPFAVELVPSEKEAILVDSLGKFNKEHVVCLNDDIEGKKFLLSDNYSKEKLRAAVKNILSAYKYYSLYLIDTDSDLFTQSKYNVIEKELLESKVRLVKRNSFTCLDDDKKENVRARLDKFLQNAGADENIAVIEAGNYMSIIDKIEVLFRKGNKVIPPCGN